jgi:hypothetical protein
LIDPAHFAALAALEREWAALTEDDDGIRFEQRGASELAGAVESAVGVGRPDVAARSGGNPNHDPANGQFTSGGGGGKHARRKRRLKHRLRREHAALKGRHRAERRELAARQRERHAAHRAHYDARLAKARARKEIALQKADARHEREIAAMERRRERERAKEGDDSPEQVQKWEDRHAKDIESAREFYRASERPAHERMAEFDVGVVRQERRQAAAELKGRHGRQRQGMLRRQRAEREELRERAAAHGFKFKGAKGDAGTNDGDQSRDARGLSRAAAFHPEVAPRRLGHGRTHKAGSAESILKHCLRSLGLTDAFRRGKLTGRQSLEVLEAVRQYARDWLRHEAEQLIRQYGRAFDDRSLDLGVCDGGIALPSGGYPGGTGRSAETGEAAVGRHAADPGCHAGLSASPCRHDGPEGRVIDADSGAARGADDHAHHGGPARPAPGAPDHHPGVVGGLAGAEVARSLSDAMRHHVGRFFRRARNFVREAILAGTMALNGPGELTSDDLAEADRAAAAQAVYLDRFEADVNMNAPPELAVAAAPPDPNAMTAPQLVARAEQYAGSVWGEAINARRRAVIRAGRMRAERRLHARPMGQHDACATCEGESARGWVPIGTLAPIGDSECLGIHCDCFYTYREEAA